MDLENIRTFYPRLEAAVSKLTPEQINFPTGEGKWTPGQYLHHLADAQAQAFYRCVWILTEDKPTLKTFDQDSWVAIMGHYPIQPSMDILKGVYARWLTLLENLQDWQWGLKANHPELGEISIGDIVAYYTDHGEGHILQFTKFTE